MRKKKNQVNKININDPLNWWNKFWVVLTLLIIIIEFVGLIFFPKTFRPKFIIIIALAIPTILMLFQYRQLRKSKVFLIWLSISLFLFCVFILIKTLSISLNSELLYYIRGLKTPILFLTAYYFFRKISKAVWRTELIIPPKNSRYDIEEGRKSNVIDYVSFFGYWLIIVMSFMF